MNIKQAIFLGSFGIDPNSFDTIKKILNPSTGDITFYSETGELSFNNMNSIVNLLSTSYSKQTLVKYCRVFDHIRYNYSLSFHTKELRPDSTIEDFNDFFDNVARRIEEAQNNFDKTVLRSLTAKRLNKISSQYNIDIAANFKCSYLGSRRPDLESIDITNVNGKLFRFTSLIPASIIQSLKNIEIRRTFKDLVSESKTIKEPEEQQISMMTEEDRDIQYWASTLDI